MQLTAHENAMERPELAVAEAPNPEFYERKLEQAAEYIRLLSAQVSELSQRACQYEEYIAEIRLDKLRSHDDPGDPETMTDPHDVNLVLLNSGEFGWGDLATHKGEEQQHHIADLKEIAHEVDGPSEAQIRNSNVEDILRERDLILSQYQSAKQRLVDVEGLCESLQKKVGDNQAVVENLQQTIVGLKNAASQKFQESLDEKAAIQETIASLTLREKKLAAFVSELELRQKELKQDDERNGVYLEDIRESLLKKSKEVERLQTHLMEVETAHGHEILDLESTISVLKTELAESSRGQNTWKELMSTERELCAQALEAKEVAEEELSTLQKINQELSTKNKELTQSMQNLQSVLQNFEKSKESDVELALRAMEKDTVLFKTQAENAEKRAYDSEAQVRQLTIDRSLLTEQTETIGRLRHDVARLQNHLSEAMKRLKDGSDTDGVDRHLITNFLVQFLSLPQGDSRKFEILKIIGGILRLNDEDQVRIGLKRRTESPGEAVKKEDASFMDLWISFLHREAGLEGSEPRSSS